MRARRSRPVDLELDVDGVLVPFSVRPVSGEDPINESLLQGTAPAEPVATLVRELLPRDGLLVDVGAHLGTVALPAAAAGAGVLAVEASGWRAELLRRAASRLDMGSVEVVHAAASSRNGHPATVDHMVVVEEQGKRGEPAVTVTLDELLDDRSDPHVDVLKLDVEGAEIDVLRGATGLLERERPPAIVVEANGPALSLRGHDVAELLKSLEELGFALARVDRAQPGRLVRATGADVQPEPIADYIAQRPALSPPAGWTVVDPTEDDVVERLLATCVSLDPPFRIHAAHVIGAAPDSLRAHRAVRSALGALRRDPDSAVRAAAEVAAFPPG